MSSVNIDSLCNTLEYIWKDDPIMKHFKKKRSWNVLIDSNDETKTPPPIVLSPLVGDSNSIPSFDLDKSDENNSSHVNFDKNDLFEPRPKRQKKLFSPKMKRM